MASTFTPTNWPNVSGPYAIDINDCMGDSVGIINANTNYLLSYSRAVSSTASTQINNLSSQVTAITPGSILQIATSVETAGTIQNSNSIVNTGLTPLTLTRKSTTSKILIEVTGGRYNVDNTKALFTYFYVSTNITPTYTNLTDSTTPIGYYYHNSGNMQERNHSLKYLYTPASNISTITLQVWYKGSDSAQIWNLNDGTAKVPIVLSMTEIGG